MKQYGDAQRLMPSVRRRVHLEIMMIRIMLSSILSLALMTACEQRASEDLPNTMATSAGDPSNYRVQHEWPLLPNGYVLGQATGVGVDSHDHVFVFHRAGREWSDPFPATPIADPTIMVWDATTGELLARWGENRFIMPHGLSVDTEDNIWVTDVGLHQVLKFSHEGKLLLTVGEAGVIGSDETHFNLPTDVAVLPDGGFFVSDGYGNTRVVRFSASGEFRFDWGSKGTGPGEFDLPHGIDVDRQGRVYVADRGNARVQVFDQTGKYIAEWKSSELGRPYSIAVGNDDTAFVVDGGDQPDSLPDRSRAFQVDLNGQITTTFGRFGNYDGQFILAHDVAVGRDGAVYVVDAWGRRVQKFIMGGRP